MHDSAPPNNNARWIVAGISAVMLQSTSVTIRYMICDLILFDDKTTDNINYLLRNAHKIWKHDKQHHKWLGY